jgi:hypothetical protein
MRHAIGVGILGLALALGACTDPNDPGQRALGGAAIGAGAGAIIGGATGLGPLGGAALGGAAGAVVGAGTAPR